MTDPLQPTQRPPRYLIIDWGTSSLTWSDDDITRDLAVRCDEHTVVALEGLYQLAENRKGQIESEAIPQTFAEDWPEPD